MERAQSPNYPSLPWYFSTVLCVSYASNGTTRREFVPTFLPVSDTRWTGSSLFARLIVLPGNVIAERPGTLIKCNENGRVTDENSLRVLRFFQGKLATDFGN